MVDKKKTIVISVAALVMAVACVIVFVTVFSKNNINGVDTNVDETVNRNADMKISDEKFMIDGKTVSFSEMSIQWMLDNGFVCTDKNADFSPDRDVPALHIESYGFVKKGSEDDKNAVMVSLQLTNDSDSQQKFSSMRLQQVHVELAHEDAAVQFKDIAVEGPLGIKTGITLSELISKLGEPITVSTDEESKRCHYTTYEWLCGTKDKLRVRFGEKMGLLQFDVEVNQ